MPQQASYAFAVMLTPSVWPPLQPSVLLEGTFVGSRVRLGSLPNGQIVLSAQNEGKPVLTVAFQRIAFPQRGWVQVSYGWGDRFEVRFGDVGLVADPHAALDPLTVRTQNYVEPSKRLAGIDTALIANSSERFFVETLIDLEARVFRGTQYELIRCGALLRQLLLENLLGVANQRIRRKLTFRVVPTSAPPPIVAATAWTTIDPTKHESIATVDVRLDKFLALPLVTLGSPVVTVRDVIDVCANSKGGVHLEAPKGQPESSVTKWDAAIRIGEKELSLHVVEGICNVTLKALEPLARDIAGLDSTPVTPERLRELGSAARAPRAEDLTRPSMIGFMEGLDLEGVSRSECLETVRRPDNIQHLFPVIARDGDVGPVATLYVKRVHAGQPFSLLISVIYIPAPTICSAWCIYDDICGESSPLALLRAFVHKFGAPFSVSESSPVLMLEDAVVPSVAIGAIPTLRFQCSDAVVCAFMRPTDIAASEITLAYVIDMTRYCEYLQQKTSPIVQL